MHRRWGAGGIASRDEGERQRDLGLFQQWNRGDLRLSTVYMQCINIIIILINVIINIPVQIDIVYVHGAV